MPDITMCKDKACLQNYRCFRYTATPSPFWQSYFVESPANLDGTCNYFAETFTVTEQRTKP